MEEKNIYNNTAVFIDEANIYHSQKTLGWKIDYFKLKDYLQEKYSINSISFYTSFVNKNKKQKKRFSQLKNYGYTIFAKEIKFIIDSMGQIIKKGNLDIELALDIFKSINQFETLILFSGDSDFSHLLKLLKENNKKIIIFSTGGHVSWEIIKLADLYIDLKKIKEEIEFR